MSMTRRLPLVAAVGSLAALAVASPAQAAPVNSPGVEHISAVCDELGEVDVVVPGNGLFTPAFIVGTNVHFQPYQFTFIPDGGDPMTVNKGNAPVPADAITCRAEVEGVSLVVVGVLRGGV